jgi:hypothetical protein
LKVKKIDRHSGAERRPATADWPIKFRAVVCNRLLELSPNALCFFERGGSPIGRFPGQQTAAFARRFFCRAGSLVSAFGFAAKYL